MRKTTPQGRSHTDRHGHAVDKGKNIEYHAAFWHWIDRIGRVFGSMAMVARDHVPTRAQMARLLEFVDAMRRSLQCMVTDRIRHSKVGEGRRRPGEKCGVVAINTNAAFGETLRERRWRDERCDLNIRDRKTSGLELEVAVQSRVDIR
jgi:hypothetical protein